MSRRPSPRRSTDARAEVSALVFGRHPVREALRARRRRLHRLCLRAGLSGADVDDLRAAAREASLPIQEMEPEAFGRAVPEGANTQGVFLEAEALPTVSLEELADPPGARLLVALDGVEDPQNLGAIARVAEVAGAAGLIVAQRRSAPLGAAASRASAGALEWLPVARVTNLNRAFKSLKEKGFWLYGADSEGGEALYGLPDRAIDARRVLVLGAEGRGLRAGVRDALDHRVRVPMRGQVASLNVATAAAVVLFELGRRVEALPEV